MPPKYEKGCARFCVDARGARRLGTQWVYTGGRTLWVCDSCARQLFPTAGPLRSRSKQAANRTPLRLVDPQQS